MIDRIKEEEVFVEAFKKHKQEQFRKEYVYNRHMLIEKKNYLSKKEKSFIFQDTIQKANKC